MSNQSLSFLINAIYRKFKNSFNKQWKNTILYFLYMYIPTFFIIDENGKESDSNQVNILFFLAIAIALSFYKSSRDKKTS